MTNREYQLKPDFAAMIEGFDAMAKVQLIAQIEHYIAEFERFEKQLDAEDVARTFNEFVSETIKQSLKGYSGDSISCKPGCSYCCNINVDVSDAEAKLIIKYCDKNNIGIDWNVLKKQSIYTVNTFQKLDKRMQRCIFLDSKGQCKIYEVRPVNCRLLYSVDNPKKCDVKRGVRQVKRFVSVEAEAIGTAIATASKHGSISKMMLNIYYDKF